MLRTSGLGTRESLSGAVEHDGADMSTLRAPDGWLQPRQQCTQAPRNPRGFRSSVRVEFATRGARTTLEMGGRWDTGTASGRVSSSHQLGPTLQVYETRGSNASENEIKDSVLMRRMHTATVSAGAGTLDHAELARLRQDTSGPVHTSMNGGCDVRLRQDRTIWAERPKHLGQDEAFWTESTGTSRGQEDAYTIIMQTDTPHLSPVELQ